MGSIRMPTIPGLASGFVKGNWPQLSPQDAVDILTKLLSQDKNTLVLTGAGLSVDSGIRAYRGEDGSYTAKKNYRPIFYHEFASSKAFRQRYWARSFLGYPPVRVAQPNPSHYAISALDRLGYISNIITQNVDGLHVKAHSRIPNNLLELHGSLLRVVCLNCRDISDRNELQDRIADLNPQWAAYAHELFSSGAEPRSNPDGDVELKNQSYAAFNLPECRKCGHQMLKPSVIFFGENVSPQHKEQSMQMVQQASSLLVCGSSLATFSAYRLVKAAAERGIPVALLNLGPSRGDPHVTEGLRIDVPAIDVLPDTARALASRIGVPDATVRKLLQSGVVTPVQSHPDDAPTE